MLPKDKYTIFDKKEKRYRKSIRSMSFLSYTGPCVDSVIQLSAVLMPVLAELPKWTRVSQRVNPPGF